MGITLLALHGLFAPLQQWVGWLTSAPAPQRPRLRSHAVRAPQPAALRRAAGRTHPSWPPATRAATLPSCRPSGRVRVVRVVDALQAPASAGRMVISGRMADVCAELDRMVAIEADRPG
ncbi:MAG: hypothetical protein LH617_01645 [Ramlibacter sp.]|nr:hypothetical protein [Ramlibacter sp.]